MMELKMFIILLREGRGAAIWSFLLPVRPAMP